MSSIAKEILEDAEKEAENILRSAEAQAKRILKEAEKEAEEKYKSIIREGKDKIKIQEQQMATLFEIEVKNRLLQAKEEISRVSFQLAG